MNPQQYTNEYEYEEFKHMAVLIDADNTQLSKIDEVLEELSTYGRITVKKAYGNWKKPTLKNWEDQIMKLAIKPEQQFDYVKDKNISDIALVIGAMDLLHTGMYDAFVIVSSDSDFTPLAIRLKESGVYVIGVGENKTPVPFINACDDFLMIENIHGDYEDRYGWGATVPADEYGYPIAEPEEKKPQTSKKAKVKEAEPETEEPTPIKAPKLADIHKLLKKASGKHADDDGYTMLSAAGSFIKRVRPEFDPKVYGYPKLKDLIEAFPKKYELVRMNVSGQVPNYKYKCLVCEQNRNSK